MTMASSRNQLQLTREIKNNMIGKVRRIIFSISPDEALFSRRKFRYRDEKARAYLENIGRTFISGYHAALEETDFDKLSSRLNKTSSEMTGFAYEGAAMAFTLLDCLIPWNRKRLARFLRGTADKHIYMVHVGAGWAIARLPRQKETAMQRLHPIYRWLAMDGYGFHEGYFHPDKVISKQEIPTNLDGYSRRVFDQGLGRSLWFSQGSDVTLIPEVIASFSADRQADMWSGIGLACGYAGGVCEEEIHGLKKSSGNYLPQLAQGAAFAAKARLRAGNVIEDTEIACKVLCGLSGERAAGITDEALEDLPAVAGVSSYEAWRVRIQQRFAKENVAS